MSRWLWILGALALLAGCNRPNWSTPVDAYRSFLRALSKGETEVAWGALSTETREALAARTRDISRLSGGSISDDPAALFFVNVTPTSEVGEVKLVRQDGDRAVVSVTTRRGAGDAGVVEVEEVALVREAGGWRIWLPVGSAQPAAPADGGVPSGADAGQSTLHVDPGGAAGSESEG